MPLLAALGGLATLPVPQGDQTDRSRSALVDRGAASIAGKAIGPDDIAALGDFGAREASVGGDPPFAVSPDGREAALVLRKALPSQDIHCFAVMVVPLAGDGPVRLIDIGGTPIPEVSDLRGLADLPTGDLKAVVPTWSPDGRWLAYLRRDGERTRVWRARTDGSGIAAALPLEFDARSVRWSADGHSLLITARPGIETARAAISREGSGGYRFDRRFWPLSRAHPLPSADIKEVEYRVRVSDGKLVTGSASAGADDGARPTAALTFARSANGDLAWTAPAEPRRILGGTELHARIGGRRFTCRAPVCADQVGALWWQAGALHFVQAGSATNGGITTLARWRPDIATDPQIILSTAEALLGCQAVGSTIACARETAIHPRTLVRIDPATGSMTTVFDPNPDFAALRKGTVRRLRWRLADGAQSYGDLVLPPDRMPGTRHPLIVVQYRSRGFLRGGTGDEYPVHALAARGFAVLSVERAPFVAAGRTTAMTDFTRINAADFAERRRQLASIKAGIDQAIALGLVDGSKMGITGLSDGAATVQFALINSRLFRAAAISSCCDGPSSIHFAADRGYGELLGAAGFPGPGDAAPDFWNQYSLAANADRVRTPILMQLTEDEFRFALETFVSLDHARQPVEMFVFPGAFHQKWRPAQRLAVYRRAIDWFDYWLNGKADPDAAKRDQYARWRALAERQPR
ncbi:MAG: Atxe2 family lasso peptide isopeptidase [Pseudomonadota bacterium]